MSMELYVFYDGAFPGINAWQKSVDLLRFDLTFSRDQVTTAEGGVIRAVWKNRDVSFECRPCEFGKLLNTYDDIEFDQIWTSAYAFYWLGLPECVAACIAAVALAKMCDGVVFDPRDGLILRDGAAVSMARETELAMPKIEAALRH